MAIKKIDAHAHIYERINGYGFRGELRPIGGGRARWANGEETQLIPASMGGGEGFTLEKLIQLMDDHSVEKAMLLQGNLYGFHNEYISKSVHQYPDRLKAACAVDPFSRMAVDVLDKLLEDSAFTAVKFECSDTCGLMSFHHPFQLDGEMMDRLYQIINRKGAVLVLDIGSMYTSSYQIDAVVNIAKKYPNMQVVVCHLMAHKAGEMEELSKELEKLKLPNISFDISAVPFNTDEKAPFPIAAGYIKEAVGILGPDKIMWGSDAPGVCVKADYKTLYDYLSNAGFFSGEDLNKVFYDNAEKIYFHSKKTVGGA